VWSFDLPVSPLLGIITVRGELFFPDTQDVALHAKQVLVESTGTFTIGSCSCPFQHKALVELHGLRGAVEDPDLGSKCTF
jgi:hypothetical protein